MKLRILLLIFVLIMWGGCGKRRLRLATTTSVETSGLLDILLPPFEERFYVEVDVISAGTGRALALARKGNVDVIIVHAPEAEEEFMRLGFGIRRREFMYNDFIIAGPIDDPAHIKEAKDAVEAMIRIKENKVLFVSRGDDSGTHKKELYLWKEASILPSGDWYLLTGQGMGPTLLIANEKKAYTLVDRATYIVYKEKIDLVPLFEKDTHLHNPYGIIAVNPSIHPYIDHKMALALVEWVTSPQAQELIEDFKKNGERLFYPVGGN
jgi:tungstate transport system substrate-binding protein